MNCGDTIEECYTCGDIDPSGYVNACHACKDALMVKMNNSGEFNIHFENSEVEFMNGIKSARIGD